ncbi:hypothetical protein [Frigoribacterium sp. Leaf186]|uniref:hypothetical protein n=1 Tax=Frigoribacterium sp. Leaf186 TaxID=1736293 RepID=UPI0012FC3029|nr:hypothetical protein [Frigoribacterium sp. Leaf186]
MTNSRTGEARRRVRIRTVAVTTGWALLLGFLVPVVSTFVPDAVPSADAAVPVEVEAPDFASEVHQDPWDYSNAADQNTDAARAQSISVSGGKLSLGVRGGDWFTPVPSVSGAVSYGRDGTAESIDTSRYTRLSFRMDQPSSGTGAIVWFNCGEQAEQCGGGITFPLRPGNQVYDLALDKTSIVAGKVPWTSSRMVNLRVVPSVTQSLTQTMSVSVDWMRLYSPTTAHAAFPPGVYDTYSVEALPRPVVDSPSIAEGRDLAADQRGSSYDFTRASGTSGIRVLNAQVTGYGTSGMTAVNAPPVVNDPEVVFPVTPFSGDKYHHLSFELEYDGPFSLADSVGGGKVARLIWIANGASNFQEGEDIVTYSGANARRIDIDLSKGDPVDPTSSAPRLGWSGRTVEFLRFDPNEDRGRNTWRLKSFALRADPTAQGSTQVRFHDDAWVPGTVADVKVGRGAPGTPFETIATNVPVAQGGSAVTFALDQRAPGSYNVEVVLRHPSGGGALAFAKTPIVMTPTPGNDPKGALDTVRRVPGGVEVAGWARDADTQDSIDVHLYDSTTGRAIGVTKADGARPDVRAATGAQLGTGFRTTVALSPGRHSVCAYGINVRGGQNALIGCQDIVMDDGLPVGSVDSVVRTPGGLSASGWALDRDTLDPVGVHVYAGAAGTQVVADGTRSDVGRAYPGYGSARGWTATVARPAGTYQVCAYGIDDAGKGSPNLGCRSYTLDPRPVGSFDSAVRQGATVDLRGWALDPDTADSVDVAVYVDGRGAGVVRAGATRGDIARAYPGWGAAHGFSTTITAAPGSTVCTYGIDSSKGENTTLGCRVV